MLGSGQAKSLYDRSPLACRYQVRDESPDLYREGTRDARRGALRRSTPEARGTTGRRAAELRSIREYLGLTLVEAAIRLDVAESTMRHWEAGPAGVQVLVDEGLVDTRRGVGSFVAEVPAPEEEGVGAALEQLHRVRSAATRALQALEGQVIRPVRAQVRRPENPVTEVWGYMQSAYCRTCDEGLGGVTRGWVATEDYYDSHVSWGGHDELEHDVVLTYGASAPGDDQEEPRLRELWWERYARLQRSAEELLADHYEAAHSQALEASRISAENPAVDQLSVTLQTSPQTH